MLSLPHQKKCGVTRKQNCLLNYFFLFLEREERKEREASACCSTYPLIYAFIG